MNQTALHRLHGLTDGSGLQQGSATSILKRAVELVASPLMDVNERVLQLVASCHPPADGAARHLIASGGKGIRPVLTLLSAAAVGGCAQSAVGCAVAAELVHSATLLHDDVIDDGLVRRGEPSPRVLWGNTVSVLAGDSLFVMALQHARESGPNGALPELIDTVGEMVDGEVIQFAHRGRLDTDRETYQQIIEKKTASLFRWCARAGARCGRAPEAQIDALGRYGYHVGMAFQLRDDVLDLTADPQKLGKTLGADIADAKLTLPLLMAAHRSPELAARLKVVFDGSQRPDEKLVVEIAAAVERAGAVSATKELVRKQVDLALLALGQLPTNSATSALASVVQFFLTRGN